MMRRTLLLITTAILIGHVFLGQANFGMVPDIEKMDSSLIGKELGVAIEVLTLDTNWRVITEPPGILRGIWSTNNEFFEIQLIVERTGYIHEQRAIDFNKGIYEEIKNKKIIGISWTKNGKCKNIGEVIPQFAFGRFEGCDN